MFLCVCISPGVFLFHIPFESTHRLRAFERIFRLEQLVLNPFKISYVCITALYFSLTFEITSNA